MDSIISPLLEDFRNRAIAAGFIESSTPYVFSKAANMAGPKALILCGVHGDELNPVRSMIEFFTHIAEFDQGELRIGLANPEAVGRGVRYISGNLNRLFRVGVGSSSEGEEGRRAQALKEHLEWCDYLLDLHSTSSPSSPFAMCEPPTLEFTRDLGFGHIIVGWASLGQEAVSGDTENYAAHYGATAITVENGQHEWSGGAASATNAAKSFCSRLGFITGPTPSGAVSSKVYRLFHVHVRQNSVFRYAFPHVETFMPIEKGALIGTDGDSPIRAPCDCALIMPVPADRAKVGEDQFLLAEQLS